jgi:hypothetical protein
VRKYCRSSGANVQRPLHNRSRSSQSELGRSSSCATVEKIQNDLPAALDALYEGIEAEVGSSTRIIVVGYPLLIPDSAASTSWPSCFYLTADEKTAARDVIVRLNWTIHEATVRAGSKFEFVSPNYDGSPFEGHELCNDDSFFNGATPPPNISYSFHPNAAGQDAYRQVILQHMAS